METETLIFSLSQNGKSGHCHILLCNCRYFDVLQKCCLSSSSHMNFPKSVILIGWHGNKRDNNFLISHRSFVLSGERCGTLASFFYMF